MIDLTVWFEAFESGQSCDAQSLPEPLEYKDCASGVRCANIGGCHLPATAEYFYPDGDGLYSYCRICCHYRNMEWCRKPRVRGNRSLVLAMSIGSYTIADLVAQAKRQKHRCYWCGKRLGRKPHTDYHADHVLPLSKFRDNSASNIVAACAFCNLSKGAKLPHEWAGNGGKLL